MIGGLNDICLFHCDIFYHYFRLFVNKDSDKFARLRYQKKVSFIFESSFNKLHISDLHFSGRPIDPHQR